MNRLLIESVLAFVTLPGIVAFLIPIVVLAPGRLTALDPIALLVLFPGIVLLLWCVYEFYRSGRGTLAPWTPPVHLVVSGPYAFSRNPMYVAVLLILGGWALGFRSSALTWYAVGMTVAFHLRVVGFEEPWLADTHRQAWADYSVRVPRWIGLRQATPPKAHQTL